MGIELGVYQLFSKGKRDFLNQIFLVNKRGILAGIPRIDMEDPPISSPERQGSAGVGENALSSVEAEAEAEEGAGLNAGGSSGPPESVPVRFAPQRAGTRCWSGRQTLNEYNSPPEGGLYKVPKRYSEPLVRRGECNETSPGDRLSGNCRKDE